MTGPASLPGLELGRIIRVYIQIGIMRSYNVIRFGNGMFYLYRIVLFCLDCGGIAFQLEA